MNIPEEIQQMTRFELEYEYDKAVHNVQCWKGGFAQLKRVEYIQAELWNRHLKEARQQ